MNIRNHSSLRDIPEPPEWEGMTSLAETILRDGTPAVKQVVALATAVDENLSTPQIAKHLQYGERKIVSAMTDMLTDPSVELEVVNHAGYLLTEYVRNHATDPSDLKIHLSDISSATLGSYMPDNGGVHELAVSAATALPPAERLTTDVLSVLLNGRTNSRGEVARIKGAQLWYGNLHPEDVNDAARGVLTATAVAREAWVIPSVAVQHGFRAEHELEPDADPVVTAEEIHELRLKGVSSQLAGLSLNAFATRIHNTVGEQNVLKKDFLGNLMLPSEVGDTTASLVRTTVGDRHIPAMVGLLPDVVEGAEMRLKYGWGK